MDHQYITVQQQVVVEALLLGLRKKCINDYFVSYDGHLKVESTRILLEAGYNVIDHVDPSTHSASQLTLNSFSGNVETSAIILGPESVRPQGPRDVIVPNPDVRLEVLSLATCKLAGLVTGVERLTSSKINALLVVGSESEFNKIQEQHPSLLPPVAELQSFFTDSQQFTGSNSDDDNINNDNNEDKKEEEKDGYESEEEDNAEDEEKKERKKRGIGKEVVCRACKVGSPAINSNRVIFSILRPNVLQKQVESLIDNKASLELQRDEQIDDASYLTTEIEVLKKEIENLSKERSNIQSGSGEFEAERDLLKEEKMEVEIERDALKIEAASLRKKIHKLELELEAFYEIKSKKTYSLSDDSDDEIKTTTTTTTSNNYNNNNKNPEESMEVGLDDEDDDEEIKEGIDLIVKDDDERPGFTNMGGDGLSIKTLGRGLKSDDDDDESEGEEGKDDDDDDDEDDDDEDEDDKKKKEVKKSIKIEDDEDFDSGSEKSEESEKVDLDDNHSLTEEEEDKNKLGSDEDEEKEEEKKEEKEEKEKKVDLNLNSDSDDEVLLEKKKPTIIKKDEDDDDDHDSSDWSDS